MKHNIKSLEGFVLGATDGEIGKVKEFYFDDETWTIRYLVVETGNWLSGKLVLISPEVLSAPDWENSVFHVRLTKQQVKDSPDIDTEKPVSRQEEAKLNKHYGLEHYWEGSLWPGGIGTSGMMIPGFAPFEEEIEKANSEAVNASTGDPHLRSIAAVTGYSITATDGEAGEVEDFILDTDSWKLEFVLVDTGKWLSGKKILITPRWIKKINWAASEFILHVSTADVKNSPGYNSW